MLRTTISRRMEQKKLKEMAESPATHTTKSIAFVLMGLFGVCLIAVLGTAIWLKEDKWFSAFKDGFAFLAGALATIIGYYFGNRNTDVAFEKAREATDRARDASAKVVTAEAKAEALKNEILDVTEMNDPVTSELPGTVGEGLLDKPRREKE